MSRSFNYQKKRFLGPTHPLKNCEPNGFIDMTILVNMYNLLRFSNSRFNSQPVGGGAIGPQQIVAEKFMKIMSNIGAL